MNDLVNEIMNENYKNPNNIITNIQEEIINVAELIKIMKHNSAGALSLFLGKSFI